MVYVKIKHTAWVPDLSLCLGEGGEWGQLLASPLSSTQAAI